MIPVFPSNPSISVNSWFRVCSRSSLPPPIPVPLCLPTASISSMNTIQGEFSLAFLNKSRTLEAPTPTNISTNSEPEILKNGTPASPAIAFANRVFPVPGGPTSKTPFGILAPTAVNLSGRFKNDTTSSNSSLASSTPATSSKFTPVFASIWKRAFDLPKLIACPGPPGILFDLLNKKAMNPTSNNGKAKFPMNPRPEGDPVSVG
mmetsp:Transcript_26603/g.67577  ORF Transcript_26603/g.67577 Transcript_26603/m.67577 type:complete len:205 (+) Transcript_26603:950-1564(+)